MNKKLISTISLVITSIIWGMAFVAQSKGMDYIGPITFCALRCLLGGLFLIGMACIPQIKNLLHTEDNENLIDDAMTRRGGIICGLVLLLAMNLQQFGLFYTTPGKAGFISALNIIFVPLLQIFLGVKVTPRIVLCIILSMNGMYLLSVTEGASLNIGDLLVLLSSIFYSVHTLLLSHYSIRVQGMKLNIYQFLTSGIVSLVFALIIEDVNLESINLAMSSLLYVGIMSTAIAYTLQLIGLRNINATIASLIISMESIFAALGGYLILGQILTKRELIGCGIMFFAIIIAQIPIRERKNNY